MANMTSSVREQLERQRSRMNMNGGDGHGSTPRTLPPAEPVELASSYDDDDEATTVYDRNRHRDLVRETSAPVPTIPPAARSLSPQSLRARLSIPPGRPRNAMVLATLALGAAVVAWAAFRPPELGSVLITAAGPSRTPLDNVEIYLNGEKRCDSSPCRVHGMAPGGHILRAMAPGHLPMADVALKVEPGDEAVMNITLVPGSRGGGAVLAAVAPEATASPPSIAHDAPGLVEKKAELHLLAGKHAEGASVYIVSGNERRPVPTLPARIAVPVGKTYEVVAEKLQHDRFTSSVAFSPNDERRTVTIDLGEPDAIEILDVTKSSAARSSEAAQATATSNVKLAPKKAEPTPTPEPVARRAPAPPPARTHQAASTTGKISIVSVPPAFALLDGRPVGRTPLYGVSVTPGPHTVVFIHPEHGRKTRTVEVPAGGVGMAVGRFP
jgi:serine/threonine-protein kinase